LRCFGSQRCFGEFLDKIGLTGFPYLCEAKSNRSDLTVFRNRPDRFEVPADVSCVSAACVKWLLVGSCS
jgi:hypothetical protein